MFFIDFQSFGGHFICGFSKKTGMGVSDQMYAVPWSYDAFAHPKTLETSSLDSRKVVKLHRKRKKLVFRDNIGQIHCFDVEHPIFLGMDEPIFASSDLKYRCSIFIVPYSYSEPELRGTKPAGFRIQNTASLLRM